MHLKNIFVNSIEIFTGDDSGDKTLGIKPKVPDTTENMDETTTEIIRKINIIGLLKAKASTPISLLVESLVQQLCSLLEPDSIKAHKLYNIICEKLFEMKLIDESYSMEEFEIMRSQYQRALYQLVGVAKGSEIPKTLQYPLPNGNNLQLDSRYKKEFLELCYLGGGGFGQVYKARHRLDGSEYAVKKICIYAGTVKAFMTHLKEVKTFAILNHPNVVQYKAAWLETLGNINGKNSTKESHSVFEDSNDTQIQFRSYIHRTTTKSIFESFIHLDNDKSDTSDSEIIFANSQSGDGSFHQNSPSFDTNETDDEDNSKQICRPSEIEDSITCTKSKREWVTLYIQMALCELTLKDWLDERNKKERELMLHKPGCGDSSIKLHMEKRMGNVRKIFKQLAAGLGYIHSKGIVHHDIKPSNIFISLDGDGLLVQLGDFGLACPLEKSHNGIALGTQLYAAPEQLSGKCDLKVRRLGLSRPQLGIFFEILFIFFSE